MGRAVAALFLGVVKLLASAREKALVREESDQTDANECHHAHRPPKAVFGVNPRDVFEVHAKNGGDQVQWQKDSGDGGERAHDVVRAIALHRKMHLHRRLGALL